jgi:hypothetical protein
MTHEEIIAMAREAGFRTGHIDLTVGEPVPFIAPASGTSCIVEVQRFAALVAEKAAAKEREACAKVCDGVENGEGETAGLACECAAAIRARGTKEAA